MKNSKAPWSAYKKEAMTIELGLERSKYWQTGRALSCRILKATKSVLWICEAVFVVKGCKKVVM